MNKIAFTIELNTLEIYHFLILINNILHLKISYFYKEVKNHTLN